MQGHVGDHRGRRRALAGGLARVLRGQLFGLLLAFVPFTSILGAPPGARRVDRGRFTVVHYPEDASVAEAVLDQATRRDSFPGLARGTSRIVIQIAPNEAVFREWTGSAPRRWAAAVAFVDQRRVVVQGSRAGSASGNPMQVLRHELAHIALNDAVGAVAPLWFSEGYASFAAGEERDDGFLATNVALLFRTLPTLSGLDTMLTSSSANEARAGYALSLRAVSDLAALDRNKGLEPLLTAMKERGSFDLATRRVHALTAERFEQDWQRRTRWRFAFLSIGVDSAGVVLLLVLALLPLWRMKRREQLARLAMMRDREAELDGAARVRALDALLGSIGDGTRQSAPDA